MRHCIVLKWFRLLNFETSLHEAKKIFFFDFIAWNFLFFIKNQNVNSRKKSQNSFFSSSPWHLTYNIKKYNKIILFCNNITIVCKHFNFHTCWDSISTYFDMNSLQSFSVDEWQKKKLFQPAKKLWNWAKEFLKTSNRVSITCCHNVEGGKKQDEKK